MRSAITASSAIALSLAACGRVGFDPATDTGVPCFAPVGHDEDGDLIDDACDRCPHAADPAQGDADGDGLGDACDLDAAAQRITYFDPFLAARPEWAVFGQRTFGGDVMRVDSLTLTSGQNLSEQVGRDRFELAGRATTASNNAQVSMGIAASPAPGVYYCELYEEDARFYLRFTYTEDEATYVNLDQVELVAPFAGADFTLSLDHTPPTMTCRARWRDVEHVAAGTIPAAIDGVFFYLAQNRIVVDLRSFVRIHTD